MEAKQGLCFINVLYNSYFSLDIDVTFLYLEFSPWNEAPYEDAVEKTALGGLSLDSFLSLVCTL